MSGEKTIIQVSLAILVHETGCVVLFKVGRYYRPSEDFEMLENFQVRC